MLNKKSNKKNKNKEVKPKEIRRLASKLKSLFQVVSKKQHGFDASAIDAKMTAKLDAHGSKSAKRVAKQLAKKTKVDNKRRTVKLTTPQKIGRFVYAGSSMLVVALIALFVNSYLSKPVLLSELKDEVSIPAIELRASSKTASGYIATDSDFVVNMQTAPVKNPKKIFTISPKVDFDVVADEGKNGSTQYKIQPSEALQKDTVYTIAIAKGAEFEGGARLRKDLTWVMKVEPDFALIGITPRDRSYNIPTNSVIEFEFNHKNLDVDEFENHVTISPSVDGRFELYGLKIVFVPNDKLQADTEYRVVVDDKFTNLIGDKLPQAYSSTFNTAYKEGSSSTYFQWYESPSAINTTTNAISTGVAVSPNQDVKFTLYSVAKDEIESKFGRGFEIVVLPDSAKKVVSKVSTGSFEYIPQAKGYYVLEASISGNRKIYKVFLKTELTAVVDFNFQGTSGFVYNLDTEKAVSGLDVKIVATDGVSKTVKTDSKGYFKTDISGEYILIENGSDLFSMTVDTWFMYYHSQNGKNKAQLNFDKPIYSAGDTMNFNGIVRTLEGKDIVVPADVNQVEISIYFNDYSTPRSENQLYAPIYEGSVKVDPRYGVFDGSIEIPKNIGSGFLYINLKINGIYVLSDSLMISDYAIPKEKYTLSLDKELYQEGDHVGVDVRGEDYAGRPLIGKKIKVVVGISGAEANVFDDGVPTENTGYGSDTIFEKTLTLNKSGRNGFTVDVGEYVDTMVDRVSPIYNVTVNATPVSQDEYIDATMDNAYIALSSFDIQVKSDINNKVLKQGDSVILNFEGKDIWSNKVHGNENFNVMVERYWYEKIQTGTEYSESTKTQVPVYHVQRQNEYLEPYNLSLNANGNATLKLTDLKKGSYNVTVNYEDDTTYGTRQLTNRYRDVFEVTYTQPYSNSQDRVDIRFSGAGEIGESINVEVSSPEKGNGLVLISDSALVDSKPFTLKNSEDTYKFNLKVTENYYPYGQLCAVVIRSDTSKYGIGKYFESDCAIFSPKSDIGALDVQIKTDKETYKPGEDVTVTVNVKDENGKPVQANVALSIANKALLDSFNKYELDLEVDYLRDQFYTGLKSNPNWQISKYDEMGGLGAGGGMGNVYGRDNFTDTPLWAPSIKTDSNGVATTTFKATDMLTTWFIRAIAVDSKDKFGYASDEFKTTLTASVDLDEPHFLRVGDSYKMDVSIENYAGSSRGKLIVNCDGCKEKQKTYDVDVNNNEIKDYKFTLEPATGSELLTISAEYLVDGKRIDKITKEIPVIQKGVKLFDTAVGTINPSDRAFIADLDLSGKFNADTTNIDVTVGRKLQFGNMLYPVSVTSGSTRELANAIKINSMLYEDYDSFELNISKSAIKESIKSAYERLRQNQATNGGFGDLSYDAVNIVASTDAAEAFVAVERMGLSVSDIQKTSLASYLADKISNKTTSPIDRVRAYKGLSALDRDYALLYSEIVLDLFDDIQKDDEVEYRLSDSPLAVAYLMQAYTNIGSTGDTAYWAKSLNNMVEINEQYAHWSDPYSQYDVEKGDGYVTAQVYLALAPIEQWNLKFLTRNWMAQNGQWSNVNSTDYAASVYAMLVADKQDVGELLSNAEFEININGQSVGNYKIKKGVASSMAVSIDSKYLKDGNNQIKVISNSNDELYVTVQSKYIGQPDTFTDRFDIKREFYNLSTGKKLSPSSLQYFEPIKVRATVSTDKAAKDVVITDYVASGFEPINFVSSSVPAEYRDLFFTWKGGNNANKWGAVSFEKVEFIAYEMKANKEYVYEYVMVPSYIGSGYAGGTQVFERTDVNGGSFIGGGVVTVK